jgi:AmpE protein
VLLWVGVPVVGTLLALWFLAAAHPMLATALGLVLVVATLGPRHPGRAAEAYARDLDAEGDGLDAVADLLGGEHADVPARSAALVSALPRLMLARVYGAAGWAVLAGPAGAVLWRVVEELADWLAGSTDGHAATRAAVLAELQGVLGWLPLRGLLVSLVVVGRSDEAIATWRAWRRPPGSTRHAADLALLDAVTRAALAEPADVEDRGAHQVWSLLALLDRALLVWLGALALAWLTWSLW